MKNIVILDLDTERKSRLMILKPNDVEAPKTVEEEKSLIMNDLSLVFEALQNIILVASEKGFADKDSLIKTATDALNEMK